jgi:hypothetical protein
LKGRELEPVIIDVRGTLVGLCGVGVVSGQEGDPLARVRVSSEIERAAISLLLLHAPIEGLVSDSSSLSPLESRARISRSSLSRLSAFQYIFAGYHHGYNRIRVGQSELVVAGASQHIDFSTTESSPGFAFLGLAADGMRWCNHIAVDSWPLRSLTLTGSDLWPETSSAETATSPNEIILERLRPLCSSEAMVQLTLKGMLTREQYHKLDLRQIRRYGEEHSFALAIDDSALTLQTEGESGNAALASEYAQRLSPREELIALADEWIARAEDLQEQKALQATKEELLLAMDDIKGRR